MAAITRSPDFPHRNALFIYDTSSGDFRVATTDDFVKDFGLEVARGKISGMFTISKFGRNNAIGTDAEDIWGQGGNWNQPSSGVLHNIKSSSAADTSAGTGARTIKMAGLDQNFNLTEETVTTNGTTDVITTGKFIIVNRMLVATAGTGNGNAGTITATASGGGWLCHSANYYFRKPNNSRNISSPYGLYGLFTARFSWFSKHDKQCSLGCGIVCKTLWRRIQLKKKHTTHECCNFNI